MSVPLGNGQLMPVVFFGHGSPTNVRDDNRATRAWRAIAESIPRPSAILSISAHWVTDVTSVTSSEQLETIHDFGRSLGADLFERHYPASGSPSLAANVRDILVKHGPVTFSSGRGLDHGSWAVLSWAYPDADIPVVQLSLAGDVPRPSHLEIGTLLRPLREMGVLIAASGNIVHNLGRMDWNEASAPYDWATRFNDAVKQMIVDRDADGLADPSRLGEPAALSLPSAEHYVPLLYAFGATTPADWPSFYSDFIQYRSLSMTSVVWKSE